MCSEVERTEIKVNKIWEKVYVCVCPSCSVTSWIPSHPSMNDGDDTGTHTTAFAQHAMQCDK